MRALLVAALFAGCKSPTAEPPPPIVPGAPEVGAVDRTLNLPIGTPMGGFSARARYLGALSQQDSRQSPYNYGFVESTGIHTRPGLRAIWITNGDQDLVLLQTDTIYSFDGLVEQVTKDLERETGRDLDGRVVHTANHSHNSYGPFSDQVHFYLGGDRFNQEIFERMSSQLVDAALAAYAQKQPAAIGVGWLADWDPENEVSHDRRSDNDDVEMFEGLPPGGYGKDPFLQVMRFDALDGTPIALTYAIPIHGTLVGEDSPLLSADAGGGVTAGVEDAFDAPVVVMQLQTAGGDASPGGRGDGLARVESLGELAAPKILALYDQIVTSDAPIRMESASRHIWQAYGMIEVTRGGTVDWHYPDEPGETYVSDSVVWEVENKIPGTFDEFNAPLGAVFCGSDAPLIPGGGVYNLLPDLAPYDGCVLVDAILPIIDAIFDLTDEEAKLPMMESMKAGTLATRIGPLPTLTPDGEQVDQDLLAAFFPAEPTSMFVEQFRRRVGAELGDEWPLLVGYSQDHEGYFLPPEDWLAGGYEPNINMWGPLQGEHVMEGVLAYSDEILGTTDLAEEEDPDGYYAPTEYPTRPLPTEFVPDVTDDAGTALTAIPDVDKGDFWVPDGFLPDLAIPATVPRVQGVVQFAWKGGDAMVDLPDVVLERQEGETWVEVTSSSGRVVSDRSHDMLMAYTPDPLYPVTAPQQHYFWVAWQAVPHGGEREALPLGTYRLHARGQKYAGGSAQWPWATTPYEVASPAFEVVPAALQVEVAGDGVWVSIPTPVQNDTLPDGDDPDTEPEIVQTRPGWRLIDLDGSNVGVNPVTGAVTAQVTRSDDSTDTYTITPDRTEGAAPSGRRSHVALDLTDVVEVVVTDAFGNTGTLALGDL